MDDGAGFYPDRSKPRLSSRPFVAGMMVGMSKISGATPCQGTNKGAGTSFYRFQVKPAFGNIGPIL
jgi:hypothetical protein